MMYSIATSPTGESGSAPVLRILLVEDNSRDCEILTKLLTRRIAERITKARVEILVAHTLAEGLGFAPRANCTILDLGLPDSSPENTQSNIRNFRPPVIVTTGYDDDETRMACLQQGAEHVFVKGQIHGLCNAVLDCIAKDLFRLNDELVSHPGNEAK